jgi:hypothetical protein
MLVADEVPFEQVMKTAHDGRVTGARERLLELCGAERVVGQRPQNTDHPLLGEQGQRW